MKYWILLISICYGACSKDDTPVNSKAEEAILALDAGCPQHTEQCGMGCCQTRPEASGNISSGCSTNPHYDSRLLCTLSMTVPPAPPPGTPTVSCVGEVDPTTPSACHAFQDTMEALCITFDLYHHPVRGICSLLKASGCECVPFAP